MQQSTDLPHASDFELSDAELALCHGGADRPALSTTAPLSSGSSRSLTLATRLRVDLRQALTLPKLWRRHRFQPWQTRAS